MRIDVFKFNEHIKNKSQKYEPNWDAQKKKNILNGSSTEAQIRIVVELFYTKTMPKHEDPENGSRGSQYKGSTYAGLT